MARTKYKIEEQRFEKKTSKFILKRKILFWWEKVEIHPFCFHDRFSFVKLSTGINHVDKERGELISIELKEKQKTKRKK